MPAARIGRYRLPRCAKIQDHCRVEIDNDELRGFASYFSFFSYLHIALNCFPASTSSPIANRTIRILRFALYKCDLFVILHRMADSRRSISTAFWYLLICSVPSVYADYSLTHFLLRTSKDIARLNMSIANRPRSSCSYNAHAELYISIAALISTFSRALKTHVSSTAGNEPLSHLPSSFIQLLCSSINGA